jgi:DNA-binding NarL/FixJ family response regulator
MINIIVVEDNTHVQERLAELLKGTNEMKVIGMYADLKSAIAAQIPVKLDLIILDLKLPDVKGIEAITALRQKYETARISIYTAYENETDILNCMLAGAHGYILKDTPDDRLIAELQVIAQGGSTLTPRVAEKLMKQFTPPKLAESALSKRELEVLNFISLGLRYEDIAEELDISVHTVRHHIEKIYRKLDVTSRGQAVAQAVRSGIIKMD